MTCAVCGDSDAVEVIFRGSTVVFRVLFYDYAGELINPAGGSVALTYPVPSSSTIVEVPLTAPTEEGGYWIGEWDSRVSLPGVIQGSIHNTGGPPFGVRDFSFELSANRSNLQGIT